MRGEGLRGGVGVDEGEAPGEWAGLGGGLEEAGEVTGAGSQRAAAREARGGGAGYALRPQEWPLVASGCQKGKSNRRFTP